MGKILISVELLPKKYADSHPAGLGRSDPNQHPVLPPPIGRIKWSLMWNPCYMLQECLGPKIFRWVAFVSMLAAVINGVIFGAPVIDSVVELTEDLNSVGYVPAHPTYPYNNNTLVWVDASPGLYLGYVLLGVVVVFLTGLCYCAGRLVGKNCFYEVFCCNCCRGPKEVESDYADLYADEDEEE